MEYIIENWGYIATLIVFVVGGLVAVFRWRSLTAEMRGKQIRGWLMQAVLMAEKEFGSKTGILKLSVVYDKFCGRFPWIAKVISFEQFSNYVDDVLEEAKGILQSNDKIATIVNNDDESGGE